MDMPITDAGFDFLNEECDTIFFNDFDSKGNEIQLLRVKNKSDIIKFRIRENLFREGDEGKDKDILMDFISIKFGNIELLGEFLNLNGFLFKGNTTKERERVTSMVKAFMQTVLTGGGVQSFKVVCDGTNNNTSSNTLVVDLYVQPTYTIEFIKLNTIISASSVTTAEV